MAARFVVEMLSATKADFETHAIDGDGEESAWILRGGAREIDGEFGQKLVDEALLAIAQARALQPAEKGLPLAGRMVVIGHDEVFGILEQAAQKLRDFLDHGLRQTGDQSEHATGLGRVSLSQKPMAETATPDLEGPGA